MIFTECKNGHPIICYYEAGDEPVGAFEEVICEECGVKSYVQRLSMGGETYDEEEFFRKFPDAKKSSHQPKCPTK
jgi:hypothetical protein